MFCLPVLDLNHPCRPSAVQLAAFDLIDPSSNGSPVGCGVNESGYCDVSKFFCDPCKGLEGR